MSVIVGGAIAFLASYALEARKLKNEKFKFTREKLISVGEDFYRFSAYALLRFETVLDTYQKMLGYSQEAANIMLQVDENLKTLLTKIGENNITITSADIFFGVSGGGDIAAKFMNEIKTAEADLQEKAANHASPQELQQALEIIKTLISNYIVVIKNDRETIRKKILEILEIHPPVNRVIM